MNCRLLFCLLFFCGSLYGKIATTTRTFFDASRSRPLITTFWYPEKFAPATLYPLMVFSHDIEGSRLELAWLAEYFADNGYIVASVDHYGDCNYIKLPEVKNALWERPKDLSHLMLLLTTDPQFGPHFKQDRVVVVGYSAGAISAFWLAGARANKYPHKEGTLNYKDPRVRAIIALAPGYGAYFDRDGLMGVKVPTLVISVQDDPVYPLAPNAMHFAKNIPYAKYVKITGNGAHDFFLCPDRTQKEKLKKTMMEFLKTAL
jgi:predicted dienelactone hydrolase